MNLSNLVRQHWAALRALLVLTVIVGIAYPLFIWLVAQVPGLRDKANGSIIEVDGKPVGSSLIGQSFTDADGNPLPQYFQSRPSAAGDGYDPLATSASNLGPESIVDTPAIHARDDRLSQPAHLVCSRSAAVGELEGVDGSRPFCTGDGVGAVLSVIGPRDAPRQRRAPDQGGQRQRAVRHHADPVPDTYEGVRSSAPSSARTTPSVRSCRFAVRPGRPGGARRRRHRQRQRTGPAHLAGLRRPAGRPGGQGPRRQPRPGPQIGRRHTGRPRARLLRRTRVNVLELNMELDEKYPVKS